jgi:hypothetical protein
MTLTEFRQLKKLLTLAAANDQDHEALAAFRQATSILGRNGLTWEMALNKTVSVIQEVEEAPGDPDDDLAASFDLALRGASGTFRQTLESIREQYGARGFVTPRQRAIVEEAAERAVAAHPGGCVR